MKRSQLSFRFVSEQGVTLLELVVAALLTLSVLALGVVQVPLLKDSLRKKATTDQLEADIVRARNETMAVGARGVFLVSSDGKSYLFGFDYVPYGTTPAIEEVVFSRMLENTITATSSRPLLFDSSGRTIDENGTYVTTVLSLSEDSSVFSIASVSPIGFVSLQ